MIVCEIRCLVDGKRYIGSTTQSLEMRWGQHLFDTRSKSLSPLHAAIRLHGKDAFVMKAIASAESEDELRALEARLIKSEGTVAPNGLNGIPGGHGPRGRRRYQPDGDLPGPISLLFDAEERDALARFAQDWGGTRLATAGRMIILQRLRQEGYRRSD